MDRQALRTELPQRGIGLEPRSVACSALGIGAVLREQHADMHLVRLALEPFEEAAHAVPDAGPGLGPAHPRGLALQHPGALRRGHLAPRRIERHAALLRVLHEVVLAFLEALR